MVEESTEMGSWNWWRPFVAVVLTVVSAGSIVSITWEKPVTSELRIVGADMSFTLQEEAVGNQVNDNGEALPIEQIMSNNGVNYSRIRLWVDPEPGTSDLAAALTLAQRATDAGMGILLNLHYSDTWADQNAQKLPAAWEDLGKEELESTVHAYSKGVVSAFAEQGTPVGIVQVGNEVSDGMLWSWGKTQLSWGEYWEGFADLYQAGVAGVLAGSGGQPPKIMIHTHAADESASDFLAKVEANGMPFDIIGVTYYPFWSGSLAGFSRSLNILATRFNKDLIVAETGYPWRLDSEPGCDSVVNNVAELPDRRRFTTTPEGQAAYFTELRKVIEQVPDNHGLGYFVWEPGWLPGVPAAPGVCNRYANLTMFDWEGNALPAIDSLNPPASPRPTP
ncbi:glycoside hydrolase family 53 protein [Arthrobacter sp. Sr33]